MKIDRRGFFKMFVAAVISPAISLKLLNGTECKPASITTENSVDWRLHERVGLSYIDIQTSRGLVRIPACYQKAVWVDEWEKVDLTPPWSLVVKPR